MPESNLAFLPVDPALTYSAAGTSPETRRSRAQSARTLRKLMGGRPWHLLRNADCQRIRAELLTRYRHGSVNVHLSNLRGILKQAWRDGLMSESDYRAAADITAVKYSTLPAGTCLSREQLAKMVRSGIQEMPRKGPRRLAVLFLLWGGGLRRSELSWADYGDWDGTWLRVRGKGGRERMVPIPVARNAVNSWLQFRGYAPGPLFCPVYHGRPMPGRRLSSDVMWSDIKALAMSAGVANLTPHDLRRTRATELIRSHGLRLAQRHLGHADPRTTARYDLAPQEELLAAANSLAVPDLT